MYDEELPQGQEFDHILEKFDQANKLISHFSCVIERATEEHTRINSQLEQATQLIDDMNQLHSLHRLEHTTTTEVRPLIFDNSSPAKNSKSELSEPIEFHDILVEIDVNTVIININFKDIGQRKVAYFGRLPYKYTGGTHQAAEFPKFEYFETMCDKLKSICPEFNLENYACMATLFTILPYPVSLS